MCKINKINALIQPARTITVKAAKKLVKVGFQRWSVVRNASIAMLTSHWRSHPFAEIFGAPLKAYYCLVDQGAGHYIIVIQYIHIYIMYNMWIYLICCYLLYKRGLPNSQVTSKEHQLIFPVDLQAVAVR